MPAGDLLTEAGQVELLGYLMGQGTAWLIDEDGVSGVDDLLPVDQDEKRDLADGGIGGADTLDIGTIAVALTTNPAEVSTPGEARAAIDALRAVWKPGAVDVELWLRLEEDVPLHFTGRPRGCTIDRSMIRHGEVYALCRFTALKPEPVWSTP